MSDSFLRADVCFYPRFGMGMDGVGFCRASVRSTAVLVTASSGNRLSEFFWTGNSSVVSDTRSGAVLVMWDVRHLQCSISGCAYQPSCPCGYQVPLMCILLCTRVLVPWGGIRVLM